MQLKELMDYRIEKDGLGEKKVPADKYWGIHTARAIENFPLSGLCVSPGLIRGLVLVKKAACRTNRELGYLSETKAGAIVAACDEILAGKFSDSWPLDALQGGAGTSTHMNVNEVLANRAIELLGGEKTFNFGVGGVGTKHSRSENAKQFRRKLCMSVRHFPAQRDGH